MPRTHNVRAKGFQMGWCKVSGRKAARPGHPCRQGAIDAGGRVGGYSGGVMKKATKPAAKKATPKKMGRPSSFTRAKADALCVRLAEGESLKAICRTPGWPSISSVMRWLEANESFRAQYARAREIQAETLAAEILDIADTQCLGTIETTKEWGVEVKTADMVEHRRLQIDARKWIASKLKPKVYGTVRPEDAGEGNSGNIGDTLKSLVDHLPE